MAKETEMRTPVIFCLSLPSKTLHSPEHSQNGTRASWCTPYTAALVRRWADGRSHQVKKRLGHNTRFGSHVDLYPGRIIERYDCLKLKLYNYIKSWHLTRSICFLEKSLPSEWFWECKTCYFWSPSSGRPMDLDHSPRTRQFAMRVWSWMSFLVGWDSLHPDSYLGSWHLMDLTSWKHVEIALLVL